jgi:hypothetical protein
MKTLMVTTEVRRSTLGPALEAAIPALIATEGGVRVARYALLSLPDGPGARIDYPDDVAESAVRAVVDTHNPALAAPSEAVAADAAQVLAQLRQRRDELLGKLDTADTQLADAAWTPLLAPAKIERLRLIQQQQLDYDRLVLRALTILARQLS